MNQKIKSYIPHKEPIPYLLVKNYFNDKDVDLMLTELRFLTPKMTFQDGIQLPTKDHKKNTQIGLDELYQDRKTSNILNTMDKIYEDSELIQTLKDMSWFYEIWGYTNLDNTFEGGNVHLTDYDIEIPLERNQLMIMPSSTHHAVDEIKMIRGVDKLSGMGRYCVVRFLKLN